MSINREICLADYEVRSILAGRVTYLSPWTESLSPNPEFRCRRVTDAKLDWILLTALLTQNYMTTPVGLMDVHIDISEGTAVSNANCMTVSNQADITEYERGIRNEAKPSALYVIPGLQGKGMGSKLFGLSLACLKGIGIHHLTAYNTSDTSRKIIENAGGKISFINGEKVHVISLLGNS